MKHDDPYPRKPYTIAEHLEATALFLLCAIAAGVSESIKRLGYERVITVTFICKWYDLWVGLFVDTKKHWIYVFPIPCFGIIIKIN